MNFPLQGTLARAIVCAAVCLVAFLNGLARAQGSDSGAKSQTGKVWVMLELQKSANLRDFCLDIQEVRTWVSSQVCFNQRLTITSGSNKSDLDDGTYEGMLQSRALPQGNYRIFDYTSLHRVTGTSYSSRFPFNAEFSVVAGQDVYIGSWGAHATTAIKQWFGLADASSGSYIVLKDKFKRDEALWRKQNPASSGELINRTINADDVDTVLIVQNAVAIAQPVPPPTSSSTAEKLDPLNSQARLIPTVEPVNKRAAAAMAAQLSPKTFGFDKTPQPSEKLQKWPLSPSQLDPAVLEAASTFADGFAGPSASSELFLKIENSYVGENRDGSRRRGAFDLNEVQVFYPNTQNLVTYGRTSFARESPKTIKGVTETFDQELLVGGLIAIARTSKMSDSSMAVTKFESIGTLRSPTFSVGYVIQEHYGLAGIQLKDSYSEQSRVRLSCEWFDFPATPKALVGFGTIRYLACSRYRAVSLDPKSAEVLISRSTHAYLESLKVFVTFRQSLSREQYQKTEIIQLEMGK